MKSFYQISKVANPRLNLLEVHVSYYTVKVHKYHFVDLPLKALSAITVFHVKAVSFKWTYHGENVGLIVKL